MDNVISMLGDDFALQKTAIERMVRARLCHLLSVEAVPFELEYIVDEVSIARFNQVGSEGLSSHSVEGESQSWQDDLFAPYMHDIDLWNARQRGGPGRVRFL